MKVTFFFRWYDLWIGFFYDRRSRKLYFCPLPTLGVCFNFSPYTDDEISHGLARIAQLRLAQSSREERGGGIVETEEDEAIKAPPAKVTPGKDFIDSVAADFFQFDKK